MEGSLTTEQIQVIQQPVNRRIFIEGPAGSGKTTTGVLRMLALLRAGIPASSILVLTPQRTLTQPYQQALEWEYRSPGSPVTLLTMGGLARRMVDLFWPTISAEYGFARPDLPPAFLTLESSLYYMAHLVQPLLDEGLFDSVTIDRNRIYSQILDNLNKSATVGFPYTEISQRLRAAWIADTAQAHVYEDAQRCATLFREYCLQNNLLDFSLQIEIFRQHLWQAGAPCREHLCSTYQHLIYDNVEEDSPAAHDVMTTWLPDFESACVVYDQEAGFRRFLGADPSSAYRLAEFCEEQASFPDSLVTSQPMRAFCSQFGRALERPECSSGAALPSGALHQIIDFPTETLRFFPQMLDWVVERVEGLVASGTPPGEIVILAPLLSDSLRYALSDRLNARGIPNRSHRPSRSLREEPAAQAMLTLAALAHPDWGIRPTTFEVAYALMQLIEGLDLVRAQLLVEAVYRASAGVNALASFEKIRPEMQERITFMLGSRYERLRRWLEDYAADPVPEIDFFFSRLFGEVLSQEGFSAHTDYQIGGVCANLIESAQKFRWAVGDRQPIPAHAEWNPAPVGQEYLRMIQDGVLAAQYVQSWQIPPQDAVLLAPAYTFLLANRPVDYQFWLDIGSNAWSERLYQPLTHPFILSREWQPDHVWTDVDEYERGRDSLYRLVIGLARRCRKRVLLGLSELGENGYESRGILLRVIDTVLRQSRGYAL